MIQKRIETEGLTVSAFLPDGGGARLALWAHIAAEEAERIYDALPSDAVALMALDGENWDRDLSPWPADPVFRGSDGFSGGAPDYLAKLTRSVIPAAEAACGLRPERRALAGYSLAGLFALYALVCTDDFCGAASVSGSLWYDGWTDYLAARAERLRGRWLYISVGDAEARSRNPRMARVEAETEKTEAVALSAGAIVWSERNPGGHFRDPEGRLRRALCALAGDMAL